MAPGTRWQRLRTTTLVLVGALALAGCFTEPPTAAPAPSSTSGPTVGPSATATAGPLAGQSATALVARRTVAVHAGPSESSALLHTLANPQPSGAPLVFLVARDVGSDWLEVHLPVRPNGSRGWVRRSDVRLAGLRHRIEVSRSQHQLRLYDRGALVQTYPVGIGTASTPTPGGVFYLKELLIPTNAGGAYGPYAYGLSGFSNALTDYAGGDGVIGIHGTNDPSSVGKDASHGCIRMRNEDVTALAKLLPLGTPVAILA